MKALPGHLRTLASYLGRRFRPALPPPSRAWRTEIEDPVVGPVALSGELSTAGGDELLVALHGLGGCADSTYLLPLALRAAQTGISCLRLNLRGADRRGEDFYHAGLTADLHAALASPGLAPYRRIYLLGYSLGGHVALRAATENLDPRVVAVAGVASPLDLAECAAAIDRPSRWLYRGYLLRHLKEIYAAVAARRPVPLPLGVAHRIGYLQEWDERIVAPRHGFAGAADYYRRASVGPRLRHLSRPALLVLARDDPLIPGHTFDGALGQAPPALQVEWVRRAGHLGFSSALDLGLGGDSGLEGQILGWLRSRR